MNIKEKIKISNTCNCSIQLSLRDIIDIGIKPDTQNITTIIAASLVNTNLFGNYAVDFVFILENPYTMAQDSPIHAAYKRILQEAIDGSIALKERDTQGIVLRENLCQLLQPVTRERSLMYDSFSFGNLQQVSRETYGIRIVDIRNSRTSQIIYNPALSRVNDKGDVIKALRGETMVVLQKGQPIPNKGLIIRFHSELKDIKMDQLTLGNKLIFNIKKLILIQIHSN